MTTKPLELFYSYAREDKALRDQLNQHLVILKRQGLIREWYDQDISAGSEWGQKINEHLRSADIILLLVSSSFIASDYCYGIEMQEALRRHEAGEARVIPIILRTCDWHSTPLDKLQALPSNARPVTRWRDRDAAFTNTAQGIRCVIAEMNSTGYDTEESQSQRPGKTRKRAGTGVEEGTTTTTVSQTTNTLTALNTTLKRAIDRYYKELKEYAGKAEHELALRSAFQNLLADGARAVKWNLIPEQTIKGNIRPDGVLRDESFDLRRGIWEAKGPKSNLETEIKKKIADGYPLTNAIFENTRRAILYQNKKRFAEYDLSKPRDVHDLLVHFLTYTAPDFVNFEAAVDEFKEDIPDHARALLAIIEREQKQNKKFIAAFNDFKSLCISALDPNIKDETIKEMLVQHLLTERLFRTVFDNPDFVRRNVIAAKIEEVIDALTSPAFSRNDFLRSLDRFYVAIEQAAKSDNNDWSERQHFLNTVYERFFQGYEIKQADVLGTVYTPQEIVDFMVASVDEVLKKEFGTSISEPGVKILDPATGTGSYIVNILHRIPSHRLEHKYQHDLFCNEIALLPYYIASMNIEHEYYARMGEYESFEGICFADTLELAEGQQLSLFVEENTERVQREKDADIMVVIGNPPYNVGQMNENDNNKNRKYPIIDQRIRETYAKDSKASNKNALSDAYVKFFRWATDRLGNRDGIVCLVTNNSFVDQIAFDGMRQHLLKDFSQIYHVDLHGNVRKNPKLSGTTHNVFGIQVGVGITIAVRNSANPTKVLRYYRVPEFWRKAEKLAFLNEKANVSNIDWANLQPDNRNTWITEGLQVDFDSFMAIGTKEAKESKLVGEATIFKMYSSGVKTNRDDWAYDFSKERLIEKINRFTETYNGQVDAWKRRGNSKKTVDEFVIYEDTQIKWSRDLKLDLQRGHYATYNDEKIRTSLYRPFCKKTLFFDRILNEEVYQFPQIFPTTASEAENVMIFVAGLGADHQTFFASNTIVDVKCGISGNSTTQCFPFYTYTEDGTNRQENITDWALKQFQDRYGSQVSKWDIFHYVYGLLHHPQYRERYRENLKRDLPHIPLLHSHEAFETCRRIGQQLMDWHLNYEQAKEYHLEWLTSKDVPFSWRVEKMRLSTDKRVVVVNESLRLGPLPLECFEYRLGNRSALEWVIDQYQVTRDKRSGIESDPNRPLDDKEYIVRLVGRVVTVSVETVKLVNELAQEVTAEDWLEDTEQDVTLTATRE